MHVLRLLSALMVGLTVAVLVAGCGSGRGKSSPSSTASPPSSRGSATPAVTGFGATDADWNGAHTADNAFAAGAAYDPDPSLPQVNGHVGTHYAAVQHEDGHVLGYEYRFNDESIATAKADVLHTQFPRDARVAWFVAKQTCAQMMVTSRTLGQELGSKPIGDPQGSALVEFSSGASEDSYDPKAVNDAFFLALPLTPKRQAPGC